MLEAAAAEASRDGWMIFRATCHEGHAHVPLAALDRLLVDALQALHLSSRYRYVSGLEQGLAAVGPSCARLLESSAPASITLDEVRVACTRFFEGILYDHPVLLLLDDLQWIDAESDAVTAAISSLRMANPIVVLGASRPSIAATTHSIRFDREVPLEGLRERDAFMLAKSIYAEAPKSVIDSIVEYSQGLPINIIAIAKQAARDGIVEVNEIARSASFIYERSIRSLPPEKRDLLQCFAFLGQPIDYRIARLLYQEEDAIVRVISSVIGQYLEIVDGRFCFVHDVVSRAARETVDVPAAVSGRILALLESIEQPSIEILARIADQARSLGDHESERRALVRLADAAMEAGLWSSASNAFERALEIREPSSEEHVDFYNKYGQALRAQLRITECRTLIEQAIAEGRLKGLERGFGVLASGLIITTMMLQEYDLATRLFDEIKPLIVDEREALELIAVMAVVYAHLMHREKCEAALTELKSKAHMLSDSTATFAAIAESTMNDWLGNSSMAESILRGAKIRAGASQGLQRIGIDSHLILQGLKSRGRRVVSERIRAFVNAYGNVNRQLASRLEFFRDFLQGRWPQVEAAFEEVRSENARFGSEAEIVAVGLAMAALKEKQAPADWGVEALLRREQQDGRKYAYMLTGAWALAAGEVLDKEQALDLLELWRALDGGLPWQIALAGSLDLAVAMYAVRANDGALMDAIVSLSKPRDKTPLSRALCDLARAIVFDALGAVDEVRRNAGSAERIFRSLEYDLFAAYAADRAGTANQEDLRLLEALGVRERTRRKLRRKRVTAEQISALSRRESEIAELVATGASNKEIAAKLVLSERTVEAHIANIFRKVNVNSRTQLTRWVVLHQQ